VTELQKIDQVFARLRAAATADRLRRMIFQGVVFADEIDDVAIAVQSLSLDLTEPHPLMDLLQAMVQLAAPEDAVALNAEHCAWLAEAEMRLEALSSVG
jgi:hypothetical protein